jgi:hypothetical protein
VQQLNSLPVSSLPPSWVAVLAIKKEQSTGDVVVSTNPVASTPTVACGHRCAHIFMATEILQGKIGWSGAPASLSVSGAPKVQWSTGGFNQNGYVHRFRDASVPNMVKPRSLALNLCFKSPQMMLPHDLNHIHQIHQNHHSDENFSRTPMIQIDSRMDMCIYIYIHQNQTLIMMIPWKISCVPNDYSNPKKKIPFRCEVSGWKRSILCFPEKSSILFSRCPTVPSIWGQKRHTEAKGPSRVVHMPRWACSPGNLPAQVTSQMVKEEDRVVEEVPPSNNLRKLSWWLKWGEWGTGSCRWKFKQFKPSTWISYLTT